MASDSDLALARQLPDVSINKRIYQSYPTRTNRTSLGCGFLAYEIPSTDLIDTFERSRRNTADISNFSLKKERNKIPHRKHKRKVPISSSWSLKVKTVFTILLHTLLRALTVSTKLYYWTKLGGWQIWQSFIKKLFYFKSLIDNYVLPHTWLKNTGILISAIILYVFDPEPQVFFMVICLCVGCYKCFFGPKGIVIQIQWLFLRQHRKFKNPPLKLTVTTADDLPSTLLQQKKTELDKNQAKPTVIETDVTQSDVCGRQKTYNECPHPKLTVNNAFNTNKGKHRTDKLDKSFNHINSYGIDFCQTGVYLADKIQSNEIQDKEFLQFETYRLGTFRDCCSLPVYAITLAKHGFYCTTQAVIKCFSCDMIFVGSMAGDIETDHTRKSPTCRMARCEEKRNRPSSEETNHQLFKMLDNIPGNCKQFKCKDNPLNNRAHISGNTCNDKPQGNYSSSKAGPEIPTYKMESEPRGIAVIINNEKFNSQPENGVKLDDRDGSKRDAEELKRLLQEMKFEVKEYENETAEGMAKIAIDISHIDHSKYDCLFFCILSHGGYSYLYGINGKLCPIKTLTEYFNSVRCNSLAGKPKLFFFQSCRGISTQPARFLKTDSSDFYGYIPDDDKLEQSIPNDADFLMSYATVPGCVSYRCPIEGSWFINSLTKNLRKYRNCDLLSILTMLNSEVSNKTVKDGDYTCKQIPILQSTLCKSVQLR